MQWGMLMLTPAVVLGSAAVARAANRMPHSKLTMSLKMSWTSRSP